MFDIDYPNCPSCQVEEYMKKTQPPHPDTYRSAKSLIYYCDRHLKGLYIKCSSSDYGFPPNSLTMIEHEIDVRKYS